MKVNKDQKLATFKVKDAAEFDPNEAVKKIEAIGPKYKATVAKKGPAVASNVKPKEATPANGESKPAGDAPPKPEPPKGEGGEKKQGS